MRLTKTKVLWAYGLIVVAVALSGCGVPSVKYIPSTYKSQSQMEADLQECRAMAFSKIDPQLFSQSNASSDSLAAMGLLLEAHKGDLDLAIHRMKCMESKGYRAVGDE